MKRFLGQFLVPLTALLLPCMAARAEVLQWEKLPNLPDKVGVAAPFAGVSGNALIVAGGANFPDSMPWEGGKKKWHDTIYVLPELKGEWKSGFKLRQPNAYGVSITTPEGLVCIGGGNATEHFSDVFLLKWKNKRLALEQLPPLPTPNAFGAGALLKDTIYVAGGIETPDATNASKAFWSLDLSIPEEGWKVLEAWPGPARMLATAAVQDGSFFVVGGTDLAAGKDGKPQRIYLKDAYRYTPGKGWREIAEMPRPAVAAPSPAPAFGSAGFLVIGGDDGSKVGFQPPEKHPGFPGEVLAYDIKTDRWSAVETTLVSRVTTPVVPWKNKIIIASGEVRPGVRSPEVWSASVRKPKQKK